VRLLVVVAATIVAWPDLAVGATFVVNSTLDAVDVLPGNGVCATAGAGCTLRAAIQEANALSGAHAITLPAGTYRLTISGRGETTAATGDLNVAANITINGSSATTTIVDGNGLDRVFAAASGNLTLNDLTVRNGNPGNTPGGGISVSGVNLTLARVVVQSCTVASGGGGIFVSGPSMVTLTDITISQNVVTGASGGGGVYLTGAITATMTRATISGNSSGFGGGIRVSGSGASPSTLTMTDSVIAQNVVNTTTIPFGSGGGVALDGAVTGTMNRVTVSNNSGCCGAGISFSGSTGSTAMLTVVDSTIAQNVSPTTGGGVYVQSGGGGATATITRTTISGNSANQGGGVYLFGGRMTFSNATIGGNTSTDAGGAIYRAPVSGTELTLVNVTVASNSSAVSAAVQLFGQISVRNTIIANSTGAASSNCSAPAPLLIDLGNNLEFPGTSCGFVLASDRRGDPLLGTLANNGGPTTTMALMAGSPAIDAGDDAACAATPVSGRDQRGVSRSVGAGQHCDIGAYERATLQFTDDPVVARATAIRALHILELRLRIDAVRVARGLAVYTWSDPTLTPASTVIKVQHIIDLRLALAEAYAAAALTPPTYTDAALTAGIAVARAVHIAELRAAVTAIE
jgi:CSLREA domain-containing protein